MRLRSVVLTAAFAAAAAVLPGSGAAAAGQCSLGLSPSKIVIDEEAHQFRLRLSNNCVAAGYDVARWDLVHQRQGVGWYADFSNGERLDHITFLDSYPKGRFVGYPVEAQQADGTPIVQNRPSFVAKYAPRLDSTTLRHTPGKITWGVRAWSWSGAFHDWYPRARVTVSLWYLPNGSNRWRWVKSATTSATGRAMVSITHPPKGDYRFMVKETPSVWASYSWRTRSTW